MDKGREVRTRHSCVNLFVEVGFQRTADLGRMAPDVEGTPSGKSTVCPEKEEKRNERNVSNIRDLISWI